MTKPGPKPGVTSRNDYLHEAEYTTHYQQEYIRCGKPLCKRCKPPEQGHGPYWYSYHYSPSANRVIKTYHGKTDPRPTNAANPLPSP